MNTDPNTYRENYQILQEVAQTLKNMQEPDIDRLVFLVEKALLAYRACKDRIESVKKALEEKLAG